MSAAAINSQATVLGPTLTGAATAEGARLLWCDLLSQIGCEAEEAINTAITQMQSLVSAGELQQSNVSGIARSLIRAKQIASTSRQIARIAEGSIRPVSERNHLASMIHRVLSERARDIRPRRRTVRHDLPAMEVAADTRLLLTLLHAVLGWALEHAESEVELLLERSQRPRDASLVCRFRHGRSEPRFSRFAGPATCGVSWQLVHYAAQALGWKIRTGEGGPMTWLALEFSCVCEESLPGVEATELPLASQQFDARSWNAIQ